MARWYRLTLQPSAVLSMSEIRAGSPHTRQAPKHPTTETGTDGREVRRPGRQVFTGEFRVSSCTYSTPLYSRLMTNTGYTLTGVTSGAGQCDCCSRNLKRLFKITSPDGREGVYGSACARKLTGWTPKLAVAEATQARADREAELRAAGHGELVDELRAIARATADRCGVAGVAGDALCALFGTWASVKRYWYAIDVERAYEIAVAARAECAA